jgi:hypothetical protein
MMLKYHRLPFVGKLVMSAGEATETAETTANTAKPGGTAEATAQTTHAANASDSAAHHHLVCPGGSAQPDTAAENICFLIDRWCRRHCYGGRGRKQFFFWGRERFAEIELGHTLYRRPGNWGRADDIYTA